MKILHCKYIFYFFSDINSSCLFIFFSMLFFTPSSPVLIQALRTFGAHFPRGMMKRKTILNFFKKVIFNALVSKNSSNFERLYS